MITDTVSFKYQQLFAPHVSGFLISQCGSFLKSRLHQLYFCSHFLSVTESILFHHSPGWPTWLGHLFCNHLDRCLSEVALPCLSAHASSYLCLGTRGTGAQQILYCISVQLELMAAVLSCFQVLFLQLQFKFSPTALLLPIWMRDGSITAITGGAVISLWLWLMRLDFIEGTCTPLCSRHTVRSTHTLTAKNFPWHYWFYPK